MTQAKPRFSSFEEYLVYSDNPEQPRDNIRYEFIEGDLIELPPESGRNNLIARRLLLALVNHGIPVELIVLHSCEVQVPVLQPKDAANRYPDLVLLREEHLQLTERRLTITLDMPPPRLIVEIVSPGKTNRDRDYVNKRSQYAAIGVPEYWLIDPAEGIVFVLTLQEQEYGTVGIFRGEAVIPSLELQGLSLTPDQILGVPRTALAD
ncbi:MAG: Uma2 family endonuclease [Oculatellaceae cyanobacterium Prado106]|jgi:Uma2 family endonuclease|nr:Uma2 family endonuclease [Oculatellaceae cyanobacterium Prado106]